MPILRATARQRGLVPRRWPEPGGGDRETPPRRSRHFREAPSRVCVVPASHRPGLSSSRIWEAQPGVQVTLSRAADRAARRNGAALYIKSYCAASAVREAADPEGQRAQLNDQIVQLVLRQVGAHDVPVRPILLAVETEDLAAAARDQTLHPGRESALHRDA